MSAVDVLAVLKSMLAASRRDRREFPLDEETEQLLDASEVDAVAAVAELMDKVDSLLVLGVSRTSIRELRASLARCEGAK